MIGWLNPIVGERFAKPVFFAGLVLLIIAGFGVWLVLHDRRVVENHGARQEARARPADAKAAADRVVITQTIAHEAWGRTEHEKLARLCRWYRDMGVKQLICE